MSQRNSTNVVKSLYPQFKRILLTQILQVNKKVGGAKEYEQIIIPSRHGWPIST